MIDPGTVANPSSLPATTTRSIFTSRRRRLRHDLRRGGYHDLDHAAVRTPYTTGNAISFDGMQMHVTGAPADNDTFTVGPSANQSVFTTLTNLITALQTPANAQCQPGQHADRVAAGIQNISQALNSVVAASSQVGANHERADFAGHHRRTRSTPNTSRASPT